MGRTRLLVVLGAVFVPEIVLARDLSGRGLIGLNTPTVVVVVSTLLIALAAVRIMRSLEARLSALIFHSTDAIFLVDRDGRIAFASPSAEELRGRSANELVGTSLLDSFAEDDREGAAQQLTTSWRCRSAPRSPSRAVSAHRTARSGCWKASAATCSRTRTSARSS